MDKGMQRVVVSGPGQVGLEFCEVPRPGPDDVLLEVAVCGLCGSDFSYIEAGGLPLQSEPMPLGHELAGTVVEVGRNVVGWRAGDRVVVNPMAADNAIGNGGSEGGFARWLLVRDAVREGCLLPLAEGVSMERGALVEPLAVALHALERAEVRPGAKVVVFGAGPIGLGVVAALRHRGIDDVLAVDLSEHRLALALRLGARAALRGGREALWEDIAELHGREAVHGQPALGTEIYIDAAGVGANIRAVLERARFGATLVMVALHGQETPLPLFQIMARELTLRGAMAYPEEFGAALAMLEDPELELDAMISHRYPLAEFHQALATARDVQRSAKVMVLP